MQKMLLREKGKEWATECHLSSEKKKVVTDLEAERVTARVRAKEMAKVTGVKVKKALATEAGATNLKAVEALQYLGVSLQSRKKQ